MVYSATVEKGPEGYVSVCMCCSLTSLLHHRKIPTQSLLLHCLCLRSLSVLVFKSIIFMPDLGGLTYFPNPYFLVFCPAVSPCTTLSIQHWQYWNVLSCKKKSIWESWQTLEDDEHDRCWHCFNEHVNMTMVAFNCVSNGISLSLA